MQCLVNNGIENAYASTQKSPTYTDFVCKSLFFATLNLDFGSKDVSINTLTLRIISPCEIFSTNVKFSRYIQFNLAIK